MVGRMPRQPRASAFSAVPTERGYGCDAPHYVCFINQSKLACQTRLSAIDGGEQFGVAVVERGFVIGMELHVRTRSR